MVLEVTGAQKKETLKVLRAARFLIKRGWTKALYHNHGRFCALGAVFMASHGEPWPHSTQREQRVISLLRDELGLLGTKADTGFIETVDEYNDRQRTKKPVIDLFTRAILRLENTPTID